MNSIDDFCIFAPPNPNSAVGDAEAETVAFCTQGAKHGARQIPDGALSGVQFIKTKSYVAVMGTIKQELLNVKAGDSGGELDDGRAEPRFRSNA